MIGATLTVAGTPALRSAPSVSSRRCGAAARGSRVRASAGSSVVTETATEARPSAAIGASRSRSRSTAADLVTIVDRMPALRQDLEDRAA